MCIRDRHQANRSIKQVLGYPLVRDFRQRLAQLGACSVPVQDQHDGVDGRDAKAAKSHRTKVPGAPGVMIGAGHARAHQS